MSCYTPNHRYWVFSGREYYPSGGWLDFTFSFSLRANAMDHARQLLEVNKKDAGGFWVQVVDRRTGLVIPL